MKTQCSPQLRAVDAHGPNAETPPADQTEPDWHAAVHRLGAEPTLDGWAALTTGMLFPERWRRERAALAMLDAAGVDPNFVFQCACRSSGIREAHELVVRGVVDIEHVLAWAESRDTAFAAAAWLGMAAIVAYRRSEPFRSLRLLRRALGIGGRSALVLCEASLHADADAEFCAQVERLLDQFDSEP